jgi:uncharacterized protein (DUF2147 family)
MKRSTIASLILTFSAVFLTQEAAADNGSVFGVWETARVPEEGEVNIGHVKLEPCKNDAKKVCGKLIWSEIKIDPETGKPPLDKYNSDESLRGRSVICVQSVIDMEPTGEPNSWANGQLYSSRTGKTYSGSMVLKDKDHLDLTGSVLMGLISRTTTWKRVANENDPCK